MSSETNAPLQINPDDKQFSEVVRELADRWDDS